MIREEDTKEKPASVSRQERISSIIEATGWGVFFIWVGIAMLAELGFGIGLLGVALLIVLGQVARMVFKLKPEGFWLVIGACFAISGIWNLTNTEASLMPFLFIVLGAAIFLRLLANQREASAH